MSEALVVNLRLQLSKTTAIRSPSNYSRCVKAMAVAVRDETVYCTSNNRVLSGHEMKRQPSICIEGRWLQGKDKQPDCLRGPLKIKIVNCIAIAYLILPFSFFKNSLFLFVHEGKTHLGFGK